MKKLMILMLGLFSFVMVEAQTPTSCCTTKKECKPKTCCPSQSSTSCCSTASAEKGKKTSNAQTSSIVAKKEEGVE